MKRKVYKIKIGERMWYVGVGMQLFATPGLAVPITFDEHIEVMEKLGVEATAYSEEFNPRIHTMGAIIFDKMGVKC